MKREILSMQGLPDLEKQHFDQTTDLKSNLENQNELQKVRYLYTEEIKLCLKDHASRVLNQEAESRGCVRTSGKLVTG